MTGTNADLRHNNADGQFPSASLSKGVQPEKAVDNNNQHRDKKGADSWVQSELHTVDCAPDGESTKSPNKDRRAVNSTREKQVSAGRDRRGCISRQQLNRAKKSEPRDYLLAVDPSIRHE